MPGEPLSNLLPIASRDEFLGLVRDLVSAVVLLHRSRILHLDIKPSNVIAPPPRRGRAVLIDFGLVRTSLSRDPGCELRGSLPYMGPEYFRREAIGPWTDVYALGVTLYRLSTGEHPRRGAAAGPPHSLDSPAWNPAPVPPSRLCAWASPELDSIVLRCLALEPASRFDDAVELAAALDRWSSGPGRGGREPGIAVETLGRTVELARIDAFLRHLVPGARAEPPTRIEAPPSPVALVVTGPSGMGHSHLLREAKVRAQTRGIQLYLETGYPGRTTAPGSVLRALGTHVGAAADGRSSSECDDADASEGQSTSRRPPRDGSEEAGRRWRRFLSRLGQPRRSARHEVSDDERRLRRAGEVALIARSVREPLVIAVDGLHYWDEVSIGLVLDLARALGETSGAERPPIGLIVSYREEGPNALLLRELSDYLLRPGTGSVITLGPLELHDAVELARRGGASDDRVSGLALLQDTGGAPARIVQLAARASTSPTGDADASVSPSSRSSRRALPVDDAECRAAIALSLLDRPCSRPELARILACSSRQAASLLERIETSGIAERVASHTGSTEWIATAVAHGLATESSDAERRRLHRQIADSVVATASEAGDLKLVEAVRHYRVAGCKVPVRRHGLVAARFLKSIFLNRAALETFEAVLAVLPHDRFARRIEIELEMAELRVRLGELDAGIQRLRDLRRESPELPAALRLRVVLWLATFHCRRGDYRRSEALFAEASHLEREAGDGSKARGQGGLTRLESLFFINERAAMKVFTGSYDEARELCEEGLRLAGRARSVRERETALNLLATRANVAMREFDYDAAIQDFEKSMQIAEAIGSPANQAVILNNLGIVYGSSERYREAIRAYRDAERTSLQLDEGPSLVSTYGNLAVLQARNGEFDAADEALAKARALGPAGMGRRQELFYRHSLGLCRLYRGRYREACVEFDRAMRLADETGDELLTAFDGVYRGEALLATADYAEAERELTRWTRSSLPPRVRRMASSRLALVFAFTGRTEHVCSAIEAGARVDEPRDVPLLSAWDALYRGWAVSIAATEERGEPSCEDSEATVLEAESFFLRCDLEPAASLARWVRAESRFLRGDLDGARELARADDLRTSELTAVLYPLLRARLELERAASHRDVDRVAASLSAAGTALLGNDLPEWANRVVALRAVLHGDHPTAAGDRRLRYRQRWVDVRLPQALRPDAGDDDGDDGVRPEDDSTTAETAVLPAPGRGRGELVVRSRAMRKLVDRLDKVASHDDSVLIEGEIGTGKELIARVIHMESRRSAGPFTVLAATNLPAELVESELFGAIAGAFTDLGEDRAGILASAAGGTLLVDEVADLDLAVQAKLLRVLSERRFRPLGSETETEVDVRFLFSTARDLQSEVRAGRFRADLLHRIPPLRVRVPPLRERLEDLPGLVEGFLATGDGPRPRFSDGALRRLGEHDWPGNVRELRNAILRLRVEHPSLIAEDAVTALHKTGAGRPAFPPHLLAAEDLDVLRARLDRDWLLHHLERLDGDTTALSRRLGISRQALYRRLRKLGIRLRKGRDGE